MISISFKKYLILEGGNAQIEGHSSDSINLARHDRKKITKAIFNSLKKISEEFESFFGMPLWSKDLIISKKFMSGSTVHFFDTNISDQEFLRKKSRVGDIDVMVDEKIKEHLINFLDKMKGHEIGELTLLAHKGSAGTQISIWRLPKFGINVQIDFEMADFENTEPTEWSRFSRSSHWGDLGEGVKGAMHKLFMRSLMSKDRVDMIVQMKTKRKEEISSEWALSPTGLRRRYEPTGEREGERGVYKEVKGDYIRDLKKIFVRVFGAEPRPSEIDEMWTFGGMIDLVKRHFSKEDQQKTANGFLRLLFGPGEQGLYRGDPHRDLEEKMNAVNYMDKKGLKIDRDVLAAMQKEYYANYK